MPGDPPVDSLRGRWTATRDALPIPLGKAGSFRQRQCSEMVIKTRNGLNLLLSGRGKAEEDGDWSLSTAAVSRGVTIGPAPAVWWTP